jgi:hypothetical protein
MWLPVLWSLFRTGERRRASRVGGGAVLGGLPAACDVTWSAATRLAVRLRLAGGRGGGGRRAVGRLGGGTVHPVGQVDKQVAETMLRYGGGEQVAFR